MNLRKYHCSDSELIIEADSIASSYQQDAASFSGFNPVIFTETYAADFTGEIDLARTSANDEYLVDLQTKETADVYLKMDEIRSAYQELIFVIKRTYPNDKLMWNRFGSDDYGKIRKSVPRMLEFLEVVHHAAEENKDTLIAKGYTQEKIDRLGTLKEELAAEKREQKDALKKRPLNTEQRIALHNNVYDTMKEIHDAAQLIFAGQEAKLKEYVLPESGSSSAGVEATPEDTPLEESNT